MGRISLGFDSVTGEEKGYYKLDPWLHKDLKYVRTKVLQQVDMSVFIIDGRPGTGKSTFAAQIGYYLSRGSLCVDDIVFSDKQFIDRLNTAPIGSCIILDEAFDLLNKRSTLSSQNRILLSMMQKARVKQCFILIVLPTFYDLDKNIILQLADCLINCYRTPFGRRGQYKVYTRDDLRRLWFYGRTNQSYSQRIAKPNFFARFTKFFPVDYDKYTSKKLESLKSRVEGDTDTGHKYLRQRNVLVKDMRGRGVSVKDIAESLGMAEWNVYNILKKEEQEE